MKKHLLSTLVLVCICAVMAVALAITNDITAPIIEANEQKAANAALLEVMPNGKNFEKVDVTAYTLSATVKEAYKEDGGGFVFRLVTTGYSSNFVIMCGVSSDLTVSGALCLSSSETLGHEKTFGDNFTGKGSDGVMAVDTISGATKTTAAYKSAVNDAINASVILAGGSVDLRTEEEKLADALNEALPPGEGKFTKLFITEIIDGIDEIYAADNGAGYVCATSEELVAFDASLSLVSDTSAAVADTAHAALEAMKSSVLTDIDISGIENLPKTLTKASFTASGSYVIEIKGAGYGINGGNEYHPASGEYIVVRVAIGSNGKILDCLTLSQAETKGIGDMCADESFYSQFDGKSADTYREIDAISGATLTTNGYLKAIENAFKAVEIFETELCFQEDSNDNEISIDDMEKEDATNE